MSIRIALSILIFSLALKLSLFGQGENKTYWGQYQQFQEDPIMDTARKNELHIRFNNANFFKNNEYKNDYVKGQSLIGLFFEPSIDFYTRSNTMIRTGVHFTKFHGAEGIHSLSPLISIQHQPNPSFLIVFGSLYSTQNHGLLEPLMGFEKYLTDHAENGMQFLLNYPKLKADFWLDWEQFITKDDPFQEHFTAGAHMNIPILSHEKWKLRTDFQMLVRHKGGEIDSSDLPAGTQSNFAEGLQLKYLTDSKLIESINIEYFNLNFFEINPGDHVKIVKGQSHYTMAGLNSRFGDLMLGFWSGNDFYGPHSEPLFLSVSQYNPSLYAQERKMLCIKYQYHWALTDYLKLALRFEPYYHLDTKRIDHSWGIYLLLDKDFFISKFK